MHSVLVVANIEINKNNTKNKQFNYMAYLTHFLRLQILGVAFT